MPRVGLPVRVMHLGVQHPAHIEAVSSDQHEVVVEGRRFTLRARNGKFVREDLPYYGVWLSFRAGDADAQED